MADVTQILSQIEQGDPAAADELLPLVYEELRKLAAQQMARESPDHTLQATALVHEAFLRLADAPAVQQWDSRRHFFAAAAQAMRRILIESARRKRSLKAGANVRWIELTDTGLPCRFPPDRLLAMDELIDKLARDEPDAAEIVRLRIYAGCSVEEAAAIVGISRSHGYRQWTYARAWLLAELKD